MLWELSVTEQRYRAVLEVRAGVPVTEVADRYGVSRQSVHAWLRRYRDEGPSGLADRSHKVHQHPWQVSAELESAVCELRRAHPKWGPKRLVFEMDRRGHGTVTRSTGFPASFLSRRGGAGRRKPAATAGSASRPSCAAIGELVDRRAADLARPRPVRPHRPAAPSGSGPAWTAFTSCSTDTGSRPCPRGSTAATSPGSPPPAPSQPGRRPCRRRRAASSNSSAPSPQAGTSASAITSSALGCRSPDSASPPAWTARSPTSSPRAYACGQLPARFPSRPGRGFAEHELEQPAHRGCQNRRRSCAGCPSAARSWSADSASRLVCPTLGRPRTSRSRPTLTRSRSMTARRSSRPVRPAVTSSGTKHRLTRHHDSMSDDQLRRFSAGQRAAVASAFKLAGYEGELLVAPIASEDERAFPPRARCVQGTW
jgi:transposase